jgi:hypothetical protein
MILGIVPVSVIIISPVLSKAKTEICGLELREEGFPGLIGARRNSPV